MSDRSRRLHTRGGCTPKSASKRLCSPSGHPRLLLAQIVDTVQLSWRQSPLACAAKSFVDVRQRLPREASQDGLHRAMRLALALVSMVFFAAGCASLPESLPRPIALAEPPSQQTRLSQTAARSAPDPAVSGFRLLPSGAFAFSTRVGLARHAQQSLDVQYYMIKNDATGRNMLRELRDAGNRGVRVRLLVDDLSTAGQDTLLHALAAHAGVEVRLYNPFASRSGGLLSRFAASLFDFERLNHRMHNKLFIADGIMAVTGGRNVADEYFMRHPLANFIDLDVFVAGAIVSEFSSIFDKYWNSPYVFPLQEVSTPTAPPVALQAWFEDATRLELDQLAGDLPKKDVLGYGPLVEELDTDRLELLWGTAEVFADPPGLGTRPSAAGSHAHESATGVRFNVLDHILDAKSEVVLISPYLIPGTKGMDVIRQARRSGVKVSILTNSLASTDQPLVHTGYRRYREELLSMGTELYELSPIEAGRKSRQILFGSSVGGLHTKAVVFDQTELFIGSMNFDPRSEHYNTEMGLFIHSPAVAREAWKLANLAKLEGAHQLRLTADGKIEWLTSGSRNDEVHFDEPEASLWRRLLLNLLSPFAPEELL